MKTAALTCALMLGLCALAGAADLPRVQVCFVPDYENQQRCVGKILAAIDLAQHSILVQAYYLTDAEIIDALAKAQARHVDVKIILDETAATQEDGKEISVLKAKGLKPLVDEQHMVMNDRLMIIDGSRVITGSYDFTWAAANSNAENLLVIDDPAIAAAYTRNFEHHLAHSRPAKAAQP
jgi:phosphatidylserine/phosphatidylglycerophosphate/cardiolipin synthase-like enzyme